MKKSVINQRNNLGKYVKKDYYSNMGLGWGWIIIFISLLAYVAYLNASKPLVNSNFSVVRKTYASEIKKEDTRSWKMYQYFRWVESNNGTKGLAVTCKNKGGVNEIGWLPVKGFCFKSDWDQELTTLQYINKRLNNGWTENEVKCYWNLGKRINTCAYALGDLANSN